MTEIPFTSGPLRDWPIFEDIIDRQLIGRGFDEGFRDEVLDLMRAVYAVANRRIEVSPTAAMNLDSKLQTFFKDTVSLLFVERVDAAIDQVSLRRRVTELERRLGDRE